MSFATILADSARWVDRFKSASAQINVRLFR